MSIDAGLYGIAGAVIGAGAVYLAQWQANRAQERRDRAARQESRRLAIQESAQGFIRAAQEVERVAGSDSGPQERSRAAAALWVEHKQLSLVCSDNLRESLNVYADALGTTLWHGTPDGTEPWHYLLEPSRSFQEAARAELSERPHPPLL